jgi:hypothetical protein
VTNAVERMSSDVGNMNVSKLVTLNAVISLERCKKSRYCLGTGAI